MLTDEVTVSCRTQETSRVKPGFYATQRKAPTQGFCVIFQRNERKKSTHTKQTQRTRLTQRPQRTTRSVSILALRSLRWKQTRET